MTKELTAQGENEIDKLIDQKMVEEFHNVREDENVIFDSRLAWHFLNKPFNIPLSKSAHFSTNIFILALRISPCAIEPTNEKYCLSLHIFLTNSSTPIYFAHSRRPFK